MKTSVIDVRDMLSVLDVAGIEKRIGTVGGVESVTVNFAAATATVRYDETRLDITDIKADVRQGGYDEDDTRPGGSAAHGAAGAGASGTAPSDAPPAAEPPASAAPSSGASPVPATGATPPTADATAAFDAAPRGDASKGKTAPVMS